MKTLPSELILEKNQIASDAAWIVTLDITLTDGSTYYLVNNNENINFFKYSDSSAQEYTAIVFNIDSTKENLKGELPTVTLKIANVTRLLQAALETLNGAIGSTVVLRVIDSTHLSSNYAELTWSFDVVGVSTDAFWVTFNLGAPNPMRRRFPTYRYIADHCGSIFKSIECGYSGTFTTCGRTLDDCTIRANTSRYWGFKGLSSYGLRLVA